MNSFRNRLALGVGATTALLLVTGGWVAWEVTAKFNVERLDRDLRHLAEGNLERVMDASHWTRLDRSLAFLAGSDRPQACVLWVRNHGREVFRSAQWPAGILPEKLPEPTLYAGGKTVDPVPPPPRPGALSASNPRLPAKEPLFVTLEADGSTWRVAVTGNPYTTFVLAANLDEMDGDLARLRNRLLMVLPAVLIVVAAVAWWLASRALRPVHTLAEAAESITAEGLDRRIVAPVQDREFERLVRVFNAMLDRLEQGFHQARRFSADASHELKTPLALLQAQLEEALRAASPGSAAERTYSSLLEDVQRLKAILEKLLLLALADSGRLALQRQPMDLAAMLGDIVEDAAAAAPGLRIDLVAPAGATVAADAVLLEQALQNLMVNAAKYNRTGGRISVTLADGPETVRIAVGNTGPGIPPAAQGRIFERFFRGDPARSGRETGGTGLGLSLAREIVRAHGGELVLAASTDGWTEFACTLPRVPDQAGGGRTVPAAT